MIKRSAFSLIELILGMAMLSIVIGSSLTAFHAQRRAIETQREIRLARTELSNLAEIVRTANWEQLLDSDLAKQHEAMSSDLTTSQSGFSLSKSFCDSVSNPRVSIHRSLTEERNLETYRFEFTVYWYDPIHFVDRRERLYMWRSRK
jgi:type II secretory pathway pseudopilin PulG